MKRIEQLAVRAWRSGLRLIGTLNGQDSERNSWPRSIGLFTKIADRALRYPLWRADGPYRKARVRRFPYVIFFLADEESVRVMAVAHQKRRPGYWLRRIR